jgi:hypothetical protein
MEYDVVFWIPQDSATIVEVYGVNPMFEGIVQDGVVVLDDAGALPSGTRVRIEKIQQKTAASSSIWQRLRELGKKAELRATNLPADLAENHDHYLHGQPKRS